MLREKNGSRHRLIICDAEIADRCRPREKDEVFCAGPDVHHCVGCFGCWIKTPGRCVIKDYASDLPGRMAKSDEIWIISPILYGGYSQNIKAALDRSIGYMLPYFRIIDGEMHHKMRYPHSFRMVSCFYGVCGEKEREIAERLVKANAINFGVESYDVFFFDTPEQAVEKMNENVRHPE